jgi:hypothetical protein
MDAEALAAESALTRLRKVGNSIVLCGFEQLEGLRPPPLQVASPATHASLACATLN